ncbi:MAG TPA: ADP-ribosylglycohydrolase family protein [Ornithinibacter sp.]|nr:ADP-ribosylglycohydrolase family protein [Ornithinibacter sp.]
MRAHTLVTAAEDAMTAPSTSRDLRLWASINAAVLAYAAGDAFGVAYEFLPEPVPVDVTSIGARAGWPYGGVSDDTLLSLLTISTATVDDPEGSALSFLDELRRCVPRLRGLGPTTRAALGLPVAPHEAGLVGGTNGGMMRTALLGLAFAPDDDDRRRSLVRAMAEATHPDPTSSACAVAASKLFAVAASDLRADDLAPVLRAEADTMRLPGTGVDALRRLDEWSPPTSGVSLSPIETLLAVATVATRSRTCLEAYRLACEMGGDTDTVSALAAALVAARSPETCELFAITWIDDVDWAEIPQAAEAMTTLFTLRRASRERCA